MSGYEELEVEGGSAIKMWTQNVHIDDDAIDQMKNVARLPIIHKHVAAMPDCHYGTGATVGSVIPTKGAIIPAAVGVDIGCGMMAWQLTLNPIWPERYGVAELELADGRRIFISVAHLTKPFFSGVAETELDRLAAQYDWIDGPVVAVGDFNAAPWSRPVTRLLERTGYRATRRTPGTWPAQVGPLGVPIDLALVHNGARIVGIESFGGELNSNHRGLLLDIAVPREQ